MTNLFGQEPWARRGADDGRLALLVARLVSAETQLAALPKGTLGYAEMTADHTAIASGSDVAINGLTVTVTVGTARRIKIMTLITMSNNTANQVNFTSIKEGTTVLKYALAHVVLGGNQWTIVNSHVAVPSAGAHTYFATINATAGTLAAFSGTDRRSFVLVEDIGAT